MLNLIPTSSKAMILGALLMVTGLAGCMGGDEAQTRPCSPDTMTELEAPYDSYQAARDAPGEVYQANNTDSPVELKLLDPQSLEGINEGGLPVTVLLFNNETDEPVTDASFLIEAKMPAMGHGTTPEIHPTHEHDGMYIGCTTISMSGGWLINLDPELADGTVLEYDLPAQATGGSGGN